MKTYSLIIYLIMLLPICIGCDRYYDGPATVIDSTQGLLSLSDVAKIMSELPMASNHLDEVHNAVSSSSSNGYDEEYTMSMIFSSPGSGVGDELRGTKAKAYEQPLKDLLSDYLSYYCNTKSGSPDVQDYINALTNSDMQIYWPYSENWDRETYPIITFDPGYGAESNIAYRITFDKGGTKQVESIIVTEEVAKEQPVWVINRNDDSAYTPLDFFLKSGAKTKTQRSLSIKAFKMLRQYDSWFGGASEFFIKCGAPDGFAAASDEELKLYTPAVTDFMLVVKRKYMGKEVPFDALLLTDYTEQMEKIAFLVIEDDGGEITSWKCQAMVKYNSKSYGVDISIPYHDKDDIVWRGQLSNSFFSDKGPSVGRFGDVIITFELE